MLELIGLGAAQNVAILLPFGLMLGIVLAFGRLYHDSEMAAAQACGVGVAPRGGRRVAAGVAGHRADRAGSISISRRARRRPKPACAMRRCARGQRRRSSPGSFAASAAAASSSMRAPPRANGDLTDVFVKRSEGLSVETTVARRAHYAVSGDGESETITLYDGERVEGTPGNNRFRIMRFEQQLIPVQHARDAQRERRGVDEMSTMALLGSRDPKLHRGAAMAPGPAGHDAGADGAGGAARRLRPRQGRYAHVWIAVLVFALYANLALAGRTWLERGVIPAALGLWWVHGLFLAVSLAAILGPAA